MKLYEYTVTFSKQVVIAASSPKAALKKLQSLDTDVVYEKGECLQILDADLFDVRKVKKENINDLSHFKEKEPRQKTKVKQALQIIKD